jgi:hypothetical protein
MPGRAAQAGKGLPAAAGRPAPGRWPAAGAGPSPVPIIPLSSCRPTASLDRDEPRRKRRLAGSATACPGAVTTKRESALPRPKAARQDRAPSEIYRATETP